MQCEENWKLKKLSESSFNFFRKPGSKHSNSKLFYYIIHFSFNILLVPFTLSKICKTKLGSIEDSGYGTLMRYLVYSKTLLLLLQVIFLTREQRSY